MSISVVCSPLLRSSELSRVEIVASLLLGLDSVSLATTLNSSSCN